MVISIGIFIIKFHVTNLDTKTDSFLTPGTTQILLFNLLRHFLILRTK